MPALYLALIHLRRPLSKASNLRAIKLVPTWRNRRPFDGVSEGTRVRGQTADKFGHSLGFPDAMIPGTTYESYPPLRLQTLWITWDLVPFYIDT
jgi:hypothetical protein